MVKPLIVCFLQSEFFKKNSASAGKDSYDIGSGFGHFALAVPDAYETAKSIKDAGMALS